MKKTYQKPTLSSMRDMQGLIPVLFAAGAAATAAAASVGSAIAPGLLLAGGYAVGSAVKQGMEESREYVGRMRALEPVGNC